MNFICGTHGLQVFNHLTSPWCSVVVTNLCMSPVIYANQVWVFEFDTLSLFFLHTTRSNTFNTFQIFLIFFQPTTKLTPQTCWYPQKKAPPSIYNGTAWLGIPQVFCHNQVLDPLLDLNVSVGWSEFQKCWMPIFFWQMILLKMGLKSLGQRRYLVATRCKAPGSMLPSA